MTKQQAAWAETHDWFVSAGAYPNGAGLSGSSGFGLMLGRSTTRTSMCSKITTSYGLGQATSDSSFTIGDWVDRVSSTM